MAKKFNRALQIGTDNVTSNGVSFLAREFDAAGRVLRAEGETLPTGATVFAKSAVFRKTNVATGTKALYENTSANNVAAVWNLLGDIAASEITLAEGNVLIGNAGGVATALDIGNTNAGIAIGNGTTATIAALSGDVTMDNTGTTTLGLSTVDYQNTAGIVPADATTEDRILLVKRYSWDFADADANDDLVINNADSDALEIVDVWLDMATAEGGALTLTLRDAANGGGNAISSALDANATTIQRTTSLANNSIGALGSLYAHFSANPAVAAGVLYISYVKTTV